MDEGGRTAIETVLCAYDFSETADLALQQALRFARRHQARLVLAHVVEPIPLGPYPALIAPTNELAILDIARERISEMAESFGEDGLSVEPIVEQGVPGPTLVRIAQRVEADLIVIGTKGLTGIEHLVMGSVAEYVVRRSPYPVLTVHPGDRILDEALQTIVLPTDLSPLADRAAEAFVAAFGPWERPRVILAYADRTPPYLDPFNHEMLDRLNGRQAFDDEIAEKMKSVAGLLREAGFEVEISVLDGEPVSVITRLAIDQAADLIVLGTHGRSAGLNVLLGKTAQRIVQHAACPVLTIRTQKRVAAE